MTKKEIREKREWGLMLGEGSRVELDFDVMTIKEIEKFGFLKGVRGTVTSCYSDLHCFGKGKLYMHHILFDSGYHTRSHLVDHNTFETINWGIPFSNEIIKEIPFDEYGKEINHNEILLIL